MGKTHNHHPLRTAAAPVKEQVAYDPLDCLLLWLVVLDQDEAESALKPLGITANDIEVIRRSNPQLLQRMKKLRLAGRLLVAGKLAMLLRARLGEELMRSADAKSIAAITTAMSRMAGWMFWLPCSKDFPAAADGPGQGAGPLPNQCRSSVNT